MAISPLRGITLKKVEALRFGNIYAGDQFTLFLKSTDHECSDKTPKYPHYLGCLQNGEPIHLSNLFPILPIDESPFLFNTDFKDELDIKRLVNTGF